ncbi:Uncharacterized membrane protein YcaP, DUF421 family [Halobacillus karajensis]|uniref:YetF C-terminal domain-containing protein n=1 Tax=Halobacillus karajensis TaxID=195088 RepID=A0A024P623_9BACI|nr:DUF421 domain-containing protein [Halobacillus karajensis]CDQ18163.1 hypothetical protein BN982_00413 [Halobacillus karajensis]CDQ24514.1 hypothetical protein BN983_02798 [Halobacillus karajensis]CDQ29238.1 hypothetical protein BN981_03609 [Halobacillus karajensis]SEH58060.1 Uncharacterized membrane protein YcaP, DUF421 family [Halobacillus karajensis]
MVEFMKEILLVLGRILTILPLLLFITLFMGKRAIGELPIFDFLIIVTLGAVVGADIADPGIKHLPTAIAIVGIGILQRVVAKWKISNRTIGRLLTFEPTIIIQNGKFLNHNLKKIRYSIDNILQMLREKDVFDINEVEIAIIEANGEISVLKKAQKNSVTLEDMKISKTTSAISYPVIVEGEIYSSVLHHFNLNEDWIKQQLSQRDIIDIKHVFFASINHNLELQFSLKDESDLTLPPIKH